VNPNAINAYILAGSIGYAVGNLHGGAIGLALISFFFFVMSFFH